MVALRSYTENLEFQPELIFLVGQACVSLNTDVILQVSHK